MRFGLDGGRSMFFMYDFPAKTNHTCTYKYNLLDQKKLSAHMQQQINVVSHDNLQTTNDHRLPNTKPGLFLAYWH
jgi:hypothetical protein